MPAEGGALLCEARASNVGCSLKSNVHFGLRFSFIPLLRESANLNKCLLFVWSDFTPTLSSALFAQGLYGLSLLGPRKDNRGQGRSVKCERTSKANTTVFLTSVGHAEINALYIRMYVYIILPQIPGQDRVDLASYLQEGLSLIISIFHILIMQNS